MKSALKIVGITHPKKPKNIYTPGIYKAYSRTILENFSLNTLHRHTGVHCPVPYSCDRDLDPDPDFGSFFEKTPNIRKCSGVQDPAK